MKGYTEREDTSLTWSENRERITLQGRQLLRRVLNQALAQASREYLDGLHRGQVLQLGFSEGELKRLLLQASVKELAGASDSQ